MTKPCQNCHNEFKIDTEDIEFYAKINVPPPTFCPECRMQRRMTWRNERTLHKNTCAATKKPIISGFAKDTGYTVYDREYWWSDAWDPITYEKNFDFTKQFFTQFDELMHEVPMPAVFNARTVNCSYVQHTGEYKDGYLVSASWNGENIAYASRCNHAKDCMDVYEVFNTTLAYEDVSCIRLYNAHFSYRSENCNDSWFLFDCKNCNNCFGCSNLRNKSYYIWNKPFSKEDYKKELEKINLGSYTNLEATKIRFKKMQDFALHKYAFIVNSTDSTGDNLKDVKNCKNCFVFGDDSRDCKYCLNGGFKISDSYDGYGIGATAELLYEAFDSGVNGSRQLFVGVVYGCRNVQYCYNLTNCNDCFGCIGLRKKSYCILNKQYSKEEYETLVPKIIEHMKSAGEYGEFFPASISPFGYNETVANDYFPLPKKIALQKGYKWHDKEPSEHKISVKAEKILDDIKETKDEIINEIIECVDCHSPYRIIKKELEFLKQINVALPRKCFECRHQDRFKKINFPRLYTRTCMCTSGHAHDENSCPNTFETTYSPNQPETVYCEQCYQAEVI